MSLIEKIARAIDSCDPDRVDHALCLRQAHAALTAIMGEGDGVQEVDKRLFIEIADKADHDEEIMAGHHFTWEVEQLARHRVAAAAAERARIVANVRQGLHWETDADLADAIERGEV